ncbi:hypothetical protein [Chitinophaga eiseniae]|uniref:Uncharacterized protein n=1 Tax=Chitinophaga eiseniae TaxID=634771 RepID=A0A847SVR8_9BACT|nr:hypothetical protein [Chitinophaga eiseniae]NLR82286.1 hypothetical protein [Chitinophaga eiseniae]
MNDLTTAALMQLHADVLFTYDSRGRMLQANGPCPFPAFPVTGAPVW